MGYYIIFDTLNKKSYALSIKDTTDILGAVINCPAYQQAPTRCLRLYRMKNKKEWVNYINTNEMGN